MPESEPRRWATLVLAVAGGWLTDAAFPQRGIWPAAILGIGLLALALRRDSARWGFLVGLVWGWSFYLVHIWWAYESVGLVPWLGLSTASALFVAGFGATWVWIRRWRAVQEHVSLAVVMFALAWVAWEDALAYLPFDGFPWGRLAFSQTSGPMLRFASLGSSTLVTGLVAGLGALAAAAFLAARRAKLLVGVVSLSLIVLVPVAALAVPLGSQAESGTVMVGAVQGNVAEPGLGAFNNAREVIGNHAAGTLALSETYAGQLDVVLWPENAADYNPRTDEQARAVIDEAAAAIAAPILLGTQSYERDDAGVAVARYNDYLRWDAGVGATQVYAKRHPAPFAEYVPYRDFFRNFSDAVDLVTVNMKPGTGGGTLTIPVDGREVPFGIAICFEVAYDSLIRDTVRDGAELLVVPTNNASFGETAESEQQLAMSIFRAVEFGRSTVQISTVGVSGIITPNGVVTERAELFTADQMVAELPLRTSQTLATRLGQWPAYLTYAGTTIALLLGIVGYRRDSGTTPRSRDRSGESGRGVQPR